MNRSVVVTPNNKHDEFQSLTVSEIIWFVFLNLLLFEPFIRQFVASAQYIDEAFAVMLVLDAICRIAFAKRGKHFITPFEQTALGLLIMFVLLGLAENMMAGVQTKLSPIAIDIFACLKFPLALCAGYVVFPSCPRLLELLKGEGKFLLVLMLPFTVINQFTDIGMRYDSRYGLQSFQFMFGHPMQLVLIIVGFLSLFASEWQKNKIWLIFCYLYLVLSLRSTAIAFAAIAAVMLLTDKGNKRVRIGKFVLFGLIAIGLAWNQIVAYFGSGESARRSLYQGSFAIAAQYFPFGSGFATYGSNITEDPRYYSLLYYRYGLSNVWGLSPSYPYFISDTFWPILIGQFGLIGLVIYAISIYLFYRSSVSRALKANLAIYPALLIFVYLIVSSVSSSAFFSPTAIFLAVCLVLTTTKSNRPDLVCSSAIE